MCTARSPKGLIYMSPKTDDVNLQGTLDMLKNSRSLTKSDRAIISDGARSRASRPA
jgi:hypothetical protein